MATFKGVSDDLARRKLTTEALCRSVPPKPVACHGYIDAHAEESVGGVADLVDAIEDHTCVMELQFNRSIAAVREQVVRPRAYAEGRHHGPVPNWTSPIFNPLAESSLPSCRLSSRTPAIRDRPETRQGGESISGPIPGLDTEMSQAIQHGHSLPQT